ncbi:T-cell receptor alpha chain V region RL-5 [Podarcis lilfordi]|nr:T-cell receptor alpha chain V region RL-5 [Podarcis lilfordi]
MLLKSVAVHSDSVSQSHFEIFTTAGEDAQLHCIFNTTSSIPYLYWYRQFPNQPLEHILSKTKFSPTDDKAAKYSGTLSTERGAVDLKIQKVSLEDSAVYYCALEPTVKQKLTVTCTKL